MTSKMNGSPHARRTLAFKVLALVAPTLLSVGMAQAQDNGGYWTFGVGGGQTRGSFDERALANLNSTRPVPNAGTDFSITNDRHDVGGKVFMGRQFNRYIGMELGYFDLGKFKWQATAPSGALNGEIRAQGANLDLVGTMPITSNLSALARVGATYARTRSEYTSTGAVGLINPQPSDRQTQVKMGLGMQYAFNNNFHVRAEAEEYRVADGLDGKGKWRMYSVSLVFPFGRTAQSAPRAAYVPPMMERAPQPRSEPIVMMAPTPAPAAAPPPPVVVAQVQPMAPAIVPLRRVTYAAESMFGFDASAMRPEGKAALDSFTTELAGTQYDSISVEGHTDRLGGAAYNQTLSMQRAEAVRDYLVQTRGLAASKVSAVGKGEDQPATKPSDCQGNAQTAKLIACLQPDRRVEIEVSGTR